MENGREGESRLGLWPSDAGVCLVSDRLSAGEVKRPEVGQSRWWMVEEGQTGGARGSRAMYS